MLMAAWLPASFFCMPQMLAVLVLFKPTPVSVIARQSINVMLHFKRFIVITSFQKYTICKVTEEKGFETTGGQFIPNKIVYHVI